MAKIVFKKDKSNQLLLFPADIGSLVPDNHLVRVIDKVINQIELSPLFETYIGGGSSSYHPRMMLKVITYAYTERIYTTRRIEKALKENINFMWLSGMSTPDHGTIYNFKSKRLKEAVEDVFSSVIEVLIECGYVKAENLYVDGTKIEAAAGRYSYIWRKNTERYESTIREKVRSLLSSIDILQQEEDAQYGNSNLKEIEGEISSDKVERLVEDINRKLSEEPIPRKAKSALIKLEKECIPKLRKYEQQKEMLGDRNSCSKTDREATFFRMKEDHLGTGQLKPAYNVQIVTENQFILGFGIYQKAADTSVFIEFMNRLKGQLGTETFNIIGDAGYGSEENYDYVNENQLGNYLKYNNFDYEKSPGHKKKLFLSDHFTFDPSEDQFVCPAGQILDYAGTKKKETENGYCSERRVYRSRDCSGCEFRPRCCKGMKDRTIEISHRLNKFKAQARQNLESEIGKILRSKRGVEVESVFGQLKHNNQFRRFYSRGLKNVSTEWGILSIAHNLKKMAG